MRERATSRDVLPSVGLKNLQEDRRSFLAVNKIETLSIVDVRKTPLRWNDVLKLIREVNEIYVAKGKVVHIDIRSDNPEPDMRVRLLLRPRGNLRA